MNNGRQRRTRSDCTIETYERKKGWPVGTVRNQDGRKARKDKTVGTHRRQTGEDMF